MNYGFFNLLFINEFMYNHVIYNWSWTVYGAELFIVTENYLYSESRYRERDDFISIGKCKYKIFGSKILFFQFFGFYFLLET